MGILTADLIVQGLLSTALLGDSRQAASPTRGRRVPVLKPRSTYKAITERNVFCPGCPVPDTKALVLNRPKDCNKAERMNGGPKLLGTIVLSDPQYSVATISAGTESKAVKRCDQVPGSGKVFEIRRLKLCFETETGILQFIDMPDEKSIMLGQPLPSAMPPSPLTLTIDGLPRSLSLTVSEVTPEDNRRLWTQQARFSQEGEFGSHASLDVIRSLDVNDLSKVDLVSCRPGYKPAK